MTGRRGQAWVAAGLCLAVGLGAALRIDLGLSDPGFDRVRPARVLKSDPALLYYVTERILAAGGAPPADFRADPRVEHPRRADLPAMLTVGQEFLVAWLYRATGSDAPLHLFALWVMAFVAALAVVPVYGLARELAGHPGWGGLAALLYLASPANYRTAGFVLLREDLSLPLFALHLWLLARAVRRPGVAAWAGCGLAALAALATWHAMTFVVTLEMLCGFAWLVRTGRSPLAEGRAWIAPLVVAVGSLLVPVLRSKLLLLSVPMQLAAGLGVAALLERRGSRPALRVGGAVAGALAVLALSRLASAAWGAGLADYGHVFEMMWAKVVHLGALPDDPRALSFDARLLWQGPFETPYLRELVSGFTAGFLLLPVAALRAAPTWWRGRGDVAFAGLVAFALACTATALLVRRNLVLPGLVLPVVCAVLLARLRASTGEARAWAAGLAAAQVLCAVAILPGRQAQWYFPVQQDEIEAVLGFMESHVPADAPVAAEFVTGPAVLALRGNPILMQPKYETRESRLRTRAFLEALYFEPPEALHAWLVANDARYLLVDRQTLWQMRWVAGLPSGLDEPIPGTAAARLLSREPAQLAAVPGFELVYRSALPSDMMRLYRVRP